MKRLISAMTEKSKETKGTHVLTKVSRYDGMNHGFFHMYGIVDKAKQALEESATWLKERFA